MSIADIIVVIICLVFSAFFSGMEIAFISANKLKIELAKKQGSLSAKIISSFAQKPGRFIGTMLVGNNIALVIYGLYMAHILEPEIKTLIKNEIGVLTVQTIISTLLILITAEFLPKAFFRRIPNRSLNFLAVPLLVIYYILWLPMIIIIGIAEFFLKTLLKQNFSENKIIFGKVDLDNYLNEAVKNRRKKGELEHEVQILQNALEFPNVKVRECMVPRTDIVAVDAEATVSELHKKFIETGLSKILIFKESIDNIIGYVHSYEIFKRPESIKQVLLPAVVFPETMAAREALEAFIKKRKSIAVVVDEFGGTSGILTIEDVFEEIFGEIDDEHDVEEHTERKINESEYIFSARLEIDYLNSKYNLELPASEEYETLAGLIIHIHESIPAEKEQIEWNNFLFEIIQVAENKIEKVKLKINR
jgi:putative hemolysin